MVNRQNVMLLRFGLRKQRRRWSVQPSGGTGLTEKVQDISVLSLQGSHHRQQARDKLTPPIGLGAKTSTPPDHRWALRPLGGIIDRLHPWSLHKRPQGGLHL